MGLPGVIYSPEDIELVPRCQGEGKTAAIIGSSNVKITNPDDITVERVGYFPDIVANYTNEDEGGRLVAATKQFFFEARICHDVQRCPVNHVYVVDIGDTTDLTVNDIINRYLHAADLLADVNDQIDMEIYLDAGDKIGTDQITIDTTTYPNTFTYFLNKVDDHLYKMLHGDPSLGYSNFPRPTIAYAPTPSSATVAELTDLTDPTNTGNLSYIRSSRICLYDNPNNLAGFAGLIAGTYPWENPGKHTYKFITDDYILERPWSELVQLKEAGINCDWLFKPRSAVRYGPVWPILTSYRKDPNGQRPVDSTIYARVACDYVAKRIMDMAAGMIYEMATEDAANMVKSGGEAIIARETSLGTIAGGIIDAYVNADSPNMLDLEMNLIPPESIEQVRITTTITAQGSYITS
jgi:hypothetical protein